MRLSSLLTPGRVLFLLIALAFGIRLFFVATHQGMWGVDGGAYLLSLHYWMTGTQIEDFTRPPLAPGFLLWPFVQLFGPDGGIKGFALVCTLPVIPAFYIFTRLMLRPWPAVFATLCVMIDWMLAEMFTAGPLPMLAFACYLAAFWAIWRMAERPSRQTALVLALSLALIPYLNQTALGISLIVFPTYLLGVLWVKRSWRPLRHFAIPIFAGVLLALPALPFYLGVSPGSGLLRYPGPLVTHYRLQDAAWCYAATILPFAGLAVFRGKGLIKALSPLMFILMAVSCLVSYDESLMNVFYRSRYLQMLFFYPVAIYFAHRWLSDPDWRWLLKPAAAAITLILLGGFVFQLQAETKLGRMVSPDTAEAIEWVNRQEFTGAVSTNSYSLSLYVAALTERPSPWVQIYDPPPAYRGQHTDMVCLVGWQSDCDPDDANGRLHARYLLVERLWPATRQDIPDLGPAYYVVSSVAPWGGDVSGQMWDMPDDYDPWHITERNAHWLTPVWEKGTTKIWEVN